MTHGDLTYDLTLSNGGRSFVMVFYALSNAAYCVSLRGLGAELDDIQPLPARRVWRRAPARRMLTLARVRLFTASNL